MEQKERKAGDFFFFDQLDPPAFHISFLPIFHFVRSRWRQYTGTGTLIDSHFIPSGIVEDVGLITKKNCKGKTLGKKKEVWKVVETNNKKKNNTVCY